MDIEFEGQLQQDQYIRAVKDILTPPLRSTLIRLAIFLVAAAAVAYLFIYNQRDGVISEIENNRQRLALFAGGFLTLYLIAPYIGITRNAKNLWKKPAARRVRSGRVSPEGITYGDKLTAWESYTRKYQYDDMVLLLTARGGMSLLPRQFFRDEMDWKRFRQMVDQNAVNAKDYTR